jgi:hypothetical protein
MGAVLTETASGYPTGQQLKFYNNSVLKQSCFETTHKENSMKRSKRKTKVRKRLGA